MKPYVKPELIYEDFQLSHTVANCNPAMNHTEAGCEYDSDELFGILNDGETLFNGGSCQLKWDDIEGIYESYCLQTGADGYNLFTS